MDRHFPATHETGVSTADTELQGLRMELAHYLAAAPNRNLNPVHFAPAGARRDVEILSDKIPGSPFTTVEQLEAALALETREDDLSECIEFARQKMGILTRRSIAALPTEPPAPQQPARPVVKRLLDAARGAVSGILELLSPEKQPEAA